MIKKIAMLLLAAVLLAGATSCGAKKADITEIGKNPDMNVDDMPDISTGEDGEEETEDGEHDLGIEDMPELTDPTIIDNGHRIRLQILPPEDEEEGYAEGPDYFYYDADFRYFFEKQMSPYIYVSIEDGDFIPLVMAVSNGEVTVDELMYEGLEIQRETVNYLDPDPISSIKLLVIRIDEDVVLCRELLPEGEEPKEGEEQPEPRNIVMYSDDTTLLLEGDMISVVYAESQFISGEEEQIIYEIPPEEEGGEPQTVLFRFSDKLMDVDVVSDIVKINTEEETEETENE